MNLKSNECAICMKTYKFDDSAVLLCYHRFHKDVSIEPLNGYNYIFLCLSDEANIDIEKILMFSDFVYFIVISVCSAYRVGCTWNLCAQYANDLMRLMEKTSL